jgi:hypothetical protein
VNLALHAQLTTPGQVAHRRKFEMSKLTVVSYSFIALALSALVYGHNRAE